ncbi:Flagellar biosynthesis protein FliQ [hydrothermal vent metagenome]|uniref:Flagellar biosynthesis protein FliQ n=1 Tax=hydrothermal vent metagenome TaxID=652676 RepID=A0A3B0Z9J3_9ZZZZ
MTAETVLTIGRHAIEVAVLMALVLLIPGLVVGLLVAVFQAATQINEMTLSFVPKLILTFMVLLYAGPWLLNMLIDYTRGLFTSIPSLIG